MAPLTPSPNRSATEWLSIYHLHWAKTRLVFDLSRLHWWIQGGCRDVRPPWSNLFNFQAVFGKNRVK